MFLFLAMHLFTSWPHSSRIYSGYKSLVVITALCNVLYVKSRRRAAGGNTLQTCLSSDAGFKGINRKQLCGAIKM